jgi:hypothetical protein
MSNDLVVQLGAKLDQFASDMNQAGDMADSAESSSAGIKIISTLKLFVNPRLSVGKTVN